MQKKCVRAINHTTKNDLVFFLFFIFVKIKVRVQNMVLVSFNQTDLSYSHKLLILCGVCIVCSLTAKHDERHFVAKSIFWLASQSTEEYACHLCNV